jgi:hypothetical protein
VFFKAFLGGRHRVKGIGFFQAFDRTLKSGPFFEGAQNRLAEFFIARLFSKLVFAFFFR